MAFPYAPTDPALASTWAISDFQALMNESTPWT
jgi:hypothetical protein